MDNNDLLVLSLLGRNAFNDDSGNDVRAKRDAAKRSGSRARVFDWTKAAALIEEHKPEEAEAGLATDWGATGGVIWREGEKVHDEYTYLASTWATPCIRLDGKEIECWAYEADAPQWDSGSKWPE